MENHISKRQVRKLQSVSVFLFLYILLCVISFGEGGLLSAYLRTKNSLYQIQQVTVNDFIDESSNNTLTKRDDANAHQHEGINEDDSPSIIKVKTSYSDCGSEAKIKSLTLSPCSNRKKSQSFKTDTVASDICEIKRGSTATFALSFVPTTNATQLKAVIHGIIDYVPIPFPCPEPDACENSGISCPIQAGKQYDYQLSAPIKSSYPKMKLWVKGQLEDENGANFICVKMHVHII